MEFKLWGTDSPILVCFETGIYVSAHYWLFIFLSEKASFTHPFFVSLEVKIDGVKFF